MLRALIFLLVFYGLVTLLPAQGLMFEKFTGDGSISTNEMYGITEDKEGNKWVATTSGLLKITGNKVRKFTTADGLPGEVILKVAKDYYNRIWVAGYEGKLCFIRNDSVFRLNELNANIQKLIPNIDIILGIGSGPDGSVYFSCVQCCDLVRILPDLKHAELGYTNFEFKNYEFQCPDGTVLSFGTHKPFRKDSFALVNKTGILKKFKKHCPEKFFNLRVSLFDNGRLYIANRDTLYVYKDGVFEKKIALPERILYLKLIGHTLYIGLFYHGLYALNEKGAPVMVSNFSHGVSGIYPDAEGNLWLTTLEDGIYYSKSPAIRLIHKSNLPITRLVKHNRDLVCLVGSQYMVDRRGSIEMLPRIQKASFIMSLRLFDIYTHHAKKRELYFATNNGILIKKTPYSKRLKTAENTRSNITLMADDYFLTTISDCKTGLLFSGRYSLIYMPYTGKNLSHYFGLQILGSSSCSDASFMVSLRKKGLLKLTPREKKIDMVTVTGQPVSFIKKTGVNRFIVEREGEGLFFMDSTGRFLRSIKGSGRRIHSAELYRNYLLSGTAESIVITNLLTDEYITINASNYLPINEVMGFHTWNDTLYVSGRNSFISFPISDVLRFKPLIRLFPSSVKAGQSHLPSLTGLKTLGSEQSHFALEFYNTSHRGYADMTYYFTAMDQEGIYFSDTSAIPSFNFMLPPGNYTCSVRGRDHLTGTFSAPVVFPVYIHQSLYQKTWFIITLCAGAVGLTGAVAMVMIRKVKRREKKKRQVIKKIHDLEAQALQGQMNPHFIFNAINSIQEYILENNTEKAQHYMSEFSKMIRMVLHHNRSKIISLEEEIRLLRIYISLEEQRLRSDITFQVTNATSHSLAELYIPAMLLQPIIENSIWHGLRGLKGTKEISLSFSIETPYLRISISDNGAGLDDMAAAASGHALGIIRERLALIHNTDHPSRFLLLGNDLRGATVTLLLPLNYFKDLIS